MTTTRTNPFVRGYQNLAISRVLMITYEDDCPPCYRPLHSSQVQLPDDQVQLFPCIFCDDFALIAEGQQISDELDRQCPKSGIIRAVLYSITADDLGTPIHVGDTYSAESAREVATRLTFETGHYSRCWEISSKHLPQSAMQYLETLADSNTPTGLFFESFRVPGCSTVGCKLFCTPWTDQNLAVVDGTSAEQLRQEQLRAGVPESLVDLLQLAALADTRILIIDPDASELDRLPLFDE